MCDLIWRIGEETGEAHLRSITEEKGKKGDIGHRARRLTDSRIVPISLLR